MVKKDEKEDFMKNFVAIFIFLVAVNIFVPVFYCNISTGFDISLPKGTPNTGTDQSRQDLPAQSSSTVTVMDKAAGKLIEINLTDYLIGAAACEMPAVLQPAPGISGRWVHNC